jgi:hypothetical protein
VAGRSCSGSGQSLFEIPISAPEHTGARGQTPPVVEQAWQSPGQPLDAATRRFMEPRFGLRRAVDARRGRDGGPHLAAPGPAYDYDAVSRTIGGAVSDSAFRAFESKTWWAHPIGRSAPGAKAFHSLE